MTRISIGELAKATQFATDTIRFYERRGLLSMPRRRRSGYREYVEADVRTLLFVRRARELGFSLDDVAELLRLHTLKDLIKQQDTCQRYLRYIDTRIAELERWRRSLQHFEWSISRNDDHEHEPLFDFFDQTPSQDSAGERGMSV